MQRMKEEDARLQEIARKRQQMLREEPAYLAKAMAKQKALARLEEARDFVLPAAHRHLSLMNSNRSPSRSMCGAEAGVA